MNAQVTVETINPKTAQEWLDNKLEEQRPIRENQVHRLASEIKAGKFRLTSDAIVLVRGRLGNGQHRMSAIVQAGKSAQFIVMRTADEELYKVIDCGITRSASDVLGNVLYAKALPSIAKLVLGYDSGKISVGGFNLTRSAVLTRTQLLEYIEKNLKELTEQAQFVYQQYSLTRIVQVSIAGALLHIASRNHPEKAKEFIARVYDGNGLDASKDFRDRMIKQMGSNLKMRQPHVFALLIKSWNSFLNGTRPGSLKVGDGEEFPEIK